MAKGAPASGIEPRSGWAGMGGGAARQGGAFERLVAFSCKGRGFCPSCGARRMAQTAAWLVDDILPALDAVPVIEKSLAVYREWTKTEKK